MNTMKNTNYRRELKSFRLFGIAGFAAMLLLGCSPSYTPDVQTTVQSDVTTFRVTHSTQVHSFRAGVYRCFVAEGVHSAALSCMPEVSAQ